MPLESEFGWSRGEIALINTFGLLGLGPGGIVMGRVTDRVGVRGVVLTGAIVTGLTVLVASRAQSLWQLYALFFLSGAFGGGALFAPLMAAVGSWFRTGAGLAIGLVAAGQAAGQGGIPLASALLIEAIGCSGAFLTLGLASLVALVPLAMLVRQPPAIIAFAWAGHGLGGVVGGYLYDMTATYDLTFAVAALAGVVNLAIIGSLGLWL